MSAPSPLHAADPRAHYLAHKHAIDRAIQRVLDGGSYILGEEVAAFEREFSQYLGVGDVVGVASGTDALHLALRACGIGRGDAVATVSHTAVATVAAIELAGATPLLVDVEPVTLTMDPNSLEDAIKKYSRPGRSRRAPRLKAIIPVHLYGHPADMPAIMAIAERHDLSVIEDCAQSHGAVLQGRKTATRGHLAAFSFYPTKNLGAIGDGGAVATEDAGLAEQLRLLREYGWRERYMSHVRGMNTRLDPLQAAILRVKLPHLEADNAKRRTLAHTYQALLAVTSVALPQVRPAVEHVYHQYVVRTPERDALRAYLRDHSIATLIHYPAPVHLQPAYHARVALAPHGLPQTEQASREILSLPMHPHLAEADVRRVSELIVRWQSHTIG